MKCNVDFVQSHLTSAFRKLGFSIGRHPLPYFIVPLVVTAILSIGFCWMRLVKDVEYLYCPTTGRSLRERKAVESLFPPSNYSSDITLITRLRDVATIFLLPKDDLSVLRENIFDDAVQIDKMVYNISTTWKGRTLSFKDVCLKSFLGDCQTNDVLTLKGRMESLRRKMLRIKFPITKDFTSQRVLIYGSGLGGVTLDESNYIVDALALRLVYLLDYGSKEKSEMSQKWEENFLEVISNAKANDVWIFGESGASIDNEVNRVTETVLPLILILIPLMGSFAITSSMTSDCITSKPWVAIAACLSPALGGVSAFGLLLALGTQYIDINIVIFFLLIGIGLDDSFVLMAAWRRTDRKLKVEERLSEAYSKAAVSITITSITNCLSLCIGIASSYRITRICCIYSIVSILFAYIYEITFFGSTMAMSGIREHRNLHSLLCFAIKKDDVPDSCIFKLAYFGCRKSENEDYGQKKPFPISSFLNRFLSVMLTTKGKVVIMITFLVYLLSSSYCLTLIKENFQFQNVMRYDSYTTKYLNVHYKYFVRFCHPVQVVINETLDYSSKRVQDDIERILSSFSEVPNVGGKDFSFSWLKYYLQSVNDKKLRFAYYGYNISETNDFVAALRDVFLKFNNARTFQQHIKFNENRTQIVSSRFMILSKDVHSFTEEQRLISGLWKKVDSITYPVFVHNFWFPFYDVCTEIVSAFRTTVLSAIGLITITFFIIIPNLLCTVSILFNAVSIQIGVVGLSLWDVPLSPISMVSIMMSVGLSIDYASHVSYAYLSCKEDNPDKKTKNALRSAGYPVIQGCISTFIGVGVLSFAPSKAVLEFFRVIKLVIVISLFHGIFVIPFTLNYFEVLWNNIFHKSWFPESKKKCVATKKILDDNLYIKKILNN